MRKVKRKDYLMCAAQRNEAFCVFWGGEIHGALIACAEKRVFCLNFVAFYPKVRSLAASPVFRNSAFFEEVDDTEPDIFKEKRYCAEKEGNFIPERLPLIQL